MYLAQVNIATSLYDLDDSRMAGFVGKLDDVNALAENSPGFIWRLKSEDDNNAIDIQVTDDPRYIVNMSVWARIEDLFAFAYKSDHRGVMVQRRTWFKRPDGAYQALWWVEEDHRPTINEALARLAYLDQHGPSAHAFNFRTTFAQSASPATSLDPDPHCVGWS